LGAQHIAAYDAIRQKVTFFVSPYAVFLKALCANADVLSILCFGMVCALFITAAPVAFLCKGDFI